jgi:hypothetical protein
MKFLLLYLLAGLIIDIIFVITVRILNSVLHTNVLEDYINRESIPFVIIFIPILYPVILICVFVVTLSYWIIKFSESEKIVNFCNKILGIKE